MAASLPVAPGSAGSGALDRVAAAVAEMLARRVGLRAEPAIRGRLIRSVAEAADLRGLNVEEYLGVLRSDPDAMQDLLNRVTVQETSFFRDQSQFAALAQHVLPSLRGPVTIWSSACSNGQEPYSLAMTLAESGTDGNVIASDISTKALAHTRRAHYTDSELRGLSREHRHRHLHASGSGWTIAPALRDRVTVFQHNLLSDTPPFAPGTCSIVFCRNVLIYFRDDDVRTVLERLAAWIPPGGWLFLGYSESVPADNRDFRLVRVGDAFLYQRPDPRIVIPALRTPIRDRLRHARIEPARAPGRVSTPVPRAPAAAPSAPDPAPVPATAAEHLAHGVVALAAGDHPAAVAAFRRCIYLEPEHVVAHLHLGLAHEAAADVTSAQRAFRTARTALQRASGEHVEAALEGYAVAELERLLDQKLDPSPRRSVT